MTSMELSLSITDALMDNGKYIRGSSFPPKGYREHATDFPQVAALVTFEDLEPADLNDRTIGCALSKACYRCPVPNDAAEVGCSGCVDKVPLELSVGLVALSCMAISDIQLMCSLGLGI
jgi:hypothetical protein